MKKLVRILTLALVLAGTYSAVFSTAKGGTLAFGNGDPVPLCDPANPNCQVIGR
jgi:hypothetical protein